MPFLSDSVRDHGLADLVGRPSVDLHVLSGEPASFAQVSSLSVGVKSDAGLTGPSDAPAGGRQISVATISDGAITADGTAAYWALTDPTAGELLAANALTASQPVTAGNSFSLSAVTITLPDL